MKLINPEIRFEVTNKCNYKCVMCPREKQTREQGEMSQELFEKAFNEGVEIGMRMATLVSYGEPFADKSIKNKIEYAKKKAADIELYTITNGYYVDEDVARFLVDQSFDKIRFSWYGVSKESYAAIHGVKGHYRDLVKENILRLISIRDASNKKKPHIEVYFLQMSENQDEVDLFRREWEGVADDVSIWKPHNWSDGRDYRELGNDKRSCGRPFTGPVQIQWNGEIVPCCWDYNNNIVLGDVTHDMIASILKGREYDNLRNAHDKLEFHKFPFCDSCDQLHEAPDSLVYTTIKTSKVGNTNTNQYELDYIED